jgi:hypothetical protein
MRNAKYGTGKTKSETANPEAGTRRVEVRRAGRFRAAALHPPRVGFRGAGPTPRPAVFRVQKRLAVTYVNLYAQLFRVQSFIIDFIVVLLIIYYHSSFIIYGLWLIV